jgi:hypothetical protein
MPILPEQSCPVMRSTAGLYAYNARLLSGYKFNQLRPCERFVELALASPVRCTDLKNILCKINA